MVANNNCMHNSIPVRLRGFTLIELLITIVVLGIALSSLGVWMFNASRNSAGAMTTLRATELGRSYMQEILLKNYDQNSVAGSFTSALCDEPHQLACSDTLGPEKNESRARFNDVDDYNGLQESARDARGEDRKLYSGFSIQIDVNYAGEDLALAHREAKRITVTVTSPAAERLIFSAYRSNN